MKNNEIPTPEEMKKMHLEAQAPLVEALTQRVLEQLKSCMCANVTLNANEYGEMLAEVRRRFEEKGWKTSTSIDQREGNRLIVEQK